MHAPYPRNPFIKQCARQLTVGILYIALVSRILCIPKILKQFRAVLFPDPVAFRHRISFQLSPGSFLSICSPLRKTFSFILLYFPQKGLFPPRFVRIIFSFQGCICAPAFLVSVNNLEWYFRYLLFSPLLLTAMITGRQIHTAVREAAGLMGLYGKESEERRNERKSKGNYNRGILERKAGHQPRCYGPNRLSTF